MIDENKKLEHVYYQLLNYLTSGSNSLAVLNAFRAEFGEHQQTTDDIFLFTMLNSCFNNAVLIIANVIKGHGDSIDYAYLINQIKLREKEFEPEVFTKILEFSGEFDWALSQLSPIVNRVLELRDKTIAHVDRKHVNNPSHFLQNPPIEWNDLNSIYYIVGNGVLEVGRYLNLYQELGNIVQIANFALKSKTRKVIRFAKQLNLSSEFTPSTLIE